MQINAKIVYFSDNRNRQNRKAFIPLASHRYVIGNYPTPNSCFPLTTGFGAFVDKTILPYTNTNEKKLQKPCDENDQQCQAAFGYRHVLSLTPNEDDFRRKVSEQLISGNLDSPEGSLDALMQAAVCGVRMSAGETT